MKSELIIEASGRLAWHKRLASAASTVALWGGWLWLWAPLVKAAGELADLGARISALGLEALPAGAPVLSLSLVAVAGIPSTVVALRVLPRRRAKPEPALPISAYAHRFDLREHVIEAGRSAKISVVHHHSDGRISHVECREPGDAFAVTAERRVASRPASHADGTVRRSRPAVVPEHVPAAPLSDA